MDVVNGNGYEQGMPNVKRQRIPSTGQWEQLELLLSSPEQRQYELIRPVVLFGQSPIERARETGAAERTLYRHVQRFAERGMASLFVPPPTPPPLRLPSPMRDFIVRMKAEHPPLHLRELATMCYVRFGRRPSHHTIKRVLADTPPTQITRRYPRFHEMPDPAERRRVVVRLHADGWNATSIAAYLDTSRQTVHTTLKRWAEEGFRGLPNKGRTPQRLRRKVDLRAVTEVRRIAYRNTKIGAWRVHAELRDLGIRLSPRTCGRLLALNRALYQHPKLPPQPPKEMPFRAAHRHQFWTVCKIR